MAGDAGGLVSSAAAGAASGSWAGPVGAIGGALIGAAGSYFSGKSSADAARENYKHRYQWQVKDLQKAGLNPMLAIGNAAPNVPQPQFPNMGEAAVKGAQAGSAVALQKAQLENVQQDTLLKGSAQAVNVMTAKEIAIRAGVAEETLPFAARNAANTAQAIQEGVTKLGYEMDKLNSSAELDRQNFENNKTLMGLINEYHSLVNQARRLGLSEEKATAEFWDQAEGWGKLAQFLKQVLK